MTSLTIINFFIITINTNTLILIHQFSMFLLITSQAICLWQTIASLTFYIARLTNIVDFGVARKTVTFWAIEFSKLIGITWRTSRNLRLTCFTWMITLFTNLIYFCIVIYFEKNIKNVIEKKYLDKDINFHFFIFYDY